MTEIYYALIIFPILFIMAMSFIYSSSLAEINVEQVKLNCPYPYNSAIAYVNLTGTTIEVYNVTKDSSSSNYHVTTFTCDDANAGGLGPPTPQVYTTIYTANQNWFSLVGADLFYMKESISQFFLKVIAAGTLLTLYINAPAEVFSIPEYAYVNAILIGFILLGGFMVIRG